MKADSHVHTIFSCDSEATINEYILSAEQKGIDWICFTDHVDFNKNDYGYNYYSANSYFESFKEIKKNENKIELCAGIEFSEPHLYGEHLERLKRCPYDFIIGSIHWIGDMFPCQQVRERYSAKEFYKLYWQEVLNAVRIGGFDCLGHIDFPKRYYKELFYQEAVINEIFNEMLDKDIVLEINTSSLRKGVDTTMPGTEILQIYKLNGGRYVTIGSDAHEASDLSANNDIAKQIIENLWLTEVVFKGRQMRQVID